MLSSSSGSDSEYSYASSVDSGSSSDEDDTRDIVLSDDEGFVEDQYERRDEARGFMRMQREHHLTPIGGLGDNPVPSKEFHYTGEHVNDADVDYERLGPWNDGSVPGAYLPGPVRGLNPFRAPTRVGSREVSNTLVSKGLYYDDSQVGMGATNAKFEGVFRDPLTGEEYDAYSSQLPAPDADFTEMVEGQQQGVKLSLLQGGWSNNTARQPRREVLHHDEHFASDISVFTYGMRPDRDNAERRARRDVRYNYDDAHPDGPDGQLDMMEQPAFMHGNQNPMLRFAPYAPPTNRDTMSRHTQPAFLQQGSRGERTKQVYTRFPTNPAPVIDHLPGANRSQLTDARALDGQVVEANAHSGLALLEHVPGGAQHAARAEGRAFDGQVPAPTAVGGMALLDRTPLSDLGRGSEARALEGQVPAPTTQRGIDLHNWVGQATVLRGGDRYADGVTERPNKIGGMELHGGGAQFPGQEGACTPCGVGNLGGHRVEHVVGAEAMRDGTAVSQRRVRPQRLLPGRGIDAASSGTIPTGVPLRGNHEVPTKRPAVTGIPLGLPTTGGHAATHRSIVRTPRSDGKDVQGRRQPAEAPQAAPMATHDQRREAVRRRPAIDLAATRGHDVSVGHVNADAPADRGTVTRRKRELLQRVRHQMIEGAAQPAVRNTVTRFNERRTVARDGFDPAPHRADVQRPEAGLATQQFRRSESNQVRAAATHSTYGRVSRGDDSVRMPPPLSIRRKGNGVREIPGRHNGGDFPDQRAYEHMATSERRVENIVIQ